MKGHFYCIQCRRTQDRTQAERWFQTGYYRVITPMGVCVQCAGNADSLPRRFVNAPLPDYCASGHEQEIPSA